MNNSCNSENCISSNFSSEIESSILSSLNPLYSNENEEITILGNRGIFLNRAEVAKFNGNLNDYKINEDPNPQLITKNSENGLEYTQELAVRYLRPPNPPAPGEIIIKQVSFLF